MFTFLDYCKSQTSGMTMPYCYFYIDKELTDKLTDEEKSLVYLEPWQGCFQAWFPPDNFLLMPWAKEKLLSEFKSALERGDFDAVVKLKQMIDKIK